MKEPCIDCPDKMIDDYGYLCDLSCGKRSMWTNYMAGVKEVVDWIDEHSRMSYERDEGEVAFSHVQWHTKLKEWGL
uniref:Uncharacterized protein n=1 Tax=viral metagenome TaxID=1070528 RepID=A0A6M3LB61_9ZZZZ